MGVVRKATKSVGNVASSAVRQVKRSASSLNAERKRQLSDVASVHRKMTREAERAVKNPDVWKAAALIAAPFALPALAGAAGAAGAAGTGFMAKAAAVGGKVVGLATKAQAGLQAIQGVAGKYLGGGVDEWGISDEEYDWAMGDMEGPAPGGGGFFSGVLDRARGYIGGLSDDLKAKIKQDPSYLKGMLSRAAQHMAGAKLAGDGLSDEEKRLMNQMAGDLSTLRSQDQQLFDEKLKVAREVIQEGRAIDTEQGGLKAQRDVQVAGGVGLREADREAQMREGHRGLSAGDRARFALDTTAKGQSAYLGGLESAQDRRLNAIATGAGLLPEEAPTGAMYAGINMSPLAAARREGKATAVAGAGKMIESIVKNPKDVGDWDPDRTMDATNQ